MMNSKTMHDELAVRPFTPLAVVTSAGDRYNIRHPELAIPAPDQLYIFERPDIEGIAKPIRISYGHIVAIEPLPEKAA